MIHGVSEFFASAEHFRDFDHVSPLGNWRNLENIGQDKLGSPVLSILVEKFIENRSRFRAVFIEEIFLFLSQPLRTTLTGLATLVLDIVGPTSD